MSKSAQPRRTATKNAKKSPSASIDVDRAIELLKKSATKKTLLGMKRYAIPSYKAFGVAVGDIQRIGKSLGRSHELAEQLWKSGWYEARMLAAFVDEPARVTPEQMDRWCKEFDSWAIVDTVCFKLWDQLPHAFKMIKRWSTRRPEFEKRAAFALLACVALHNEDADDELFAECLPLIERAADDERNFVKKGVSWALRSVGRRSSPLYREGVNLARRLADSPNAAARWVGKVALRDLAKPALAKKFKS